MKVFDSFAWIEYFAGTECGMKVKKVIDDVEIIYTPSVCLTEFKAKYLREGRDPSKRVNFMENRSVITPIDKEIALKAADMKIEYKLHTIDALIYATASVKRGKLITGDAHFKDLPNTMMI
ncbi:MAG: type II toxin-antitoxin system VapC family toxin [Methanosarcinales archaeon Met12]|nr:MAG: type II toxin-antitoxin system VapC family toxin [Methanosarcinales archaeon Met12]